MSNPSTEACDHEDDHLKALEKILQNEKRISAERNDRFFVSVLVLMIAVVLSFIMGYVSGKQVGFADGRGMTLLEAQKVDAGHYVETKDGTRFIWTPPAPMPVKKTK